MRWLLLVVAVAGCQARDGELLAQAGQRAGRKLGLTRGPSTNTLTGTLRGSLGETSLSARVENRLRWDRFLADQPIEVVTTGTAAVTLKGTVPEAGLRQRAVEMAKSTLGVERVVDEMEAGAEGG
ncbi:MAG: BON domain-containing protein [Gemmataceae bacterium]